MKKLLIYILFISLAYCSFFYAQGKHGLFELPIISAFDTDLELEEEVNFFPYPLVSGNVDYGTTVYQSKIVVNWFDVSNNRVSFSYFLLNELLNLPPPHLV
ncbi:MAG: hypothetical protein H7A23_02640 [Leptospiraceae bacterium]|nr:hypothetical protein [Leptospiraceae bacterium]MCP5493429.1 hypothetical protein [Leptospiraceae bacterium]